MTTNTVENPRASDVVAPPDDLKEVLNLTRFLDSHVEPAMLLGPDGEQLPLPQEIYDVLRRVVDAMKNGRSVSISPIDRKLTTQQAADMLGVSRMTVVRLLDEHELPFEQPSTSRHRRIRLNDLLAYRERKRVESRSRLSEMTRQAVEDGLYDVDADAYTEALKKARKG